MARMNDASGKTSLAGVTTPKVQGQFMHQTIREVYARLCGWFGTALQPCVCVRQ